MIPHQGVDQGADHAVSDALPVTEMGGVIMPPVPAFYHRPTSVAAIVDQTVNRALDLVGIELEEDLFERWTGPAR